MKIKVPASQKNRYCSVSSPQKRRKTKGGLIPRVDNTPNYRVGTISNMWSDRNGKDPHLNGIPNKHFNTWPDLFIIFFLAWLKEKIFPVVCWKSKSWCWCNGEGEKTVIFKRLLRITENETDLSESQYEFRQVHYCKYNEHGDKLALCRATVGWFF